MGLLDKSYGKRMVPEYLIEALKKLDEATGGNPLVLEKMNKMEEIVDSEGNKRFVEGEGTLSTVSGVTFTYNKWSLSGTHLMIVISGVIDDATTIPVDTTLINIEVPNYIFNKIIPVIEGSNKLNQSSFNIFGTDGSTQSVTCTLRKASSDLYITTTSSLTTNRTRGFRIQFDLLIDNE